MSLEDWLKNRWIHEHTTSAQEIADLLRSAQEDLNSASVEGISAGWRLSMAYTASLRCARAALYASGYRPGREREHERLLDSVKYTIKPLEPETIELLHKIRKKRHIAVYDSIELVTDPEAKAAMKVAKELYGVTRRWLKENYPELLIQ